MTAHATWPRPRELPPADVRLCVVEASAGTGKTFFLEHRVADLVLAGASIDQLLVVTFTEKATAELRQRLRALLERMATAPADAGADTEAEADAPRWRLDDEARVRLRQAVSQFDRAAVHTIHAFCQRLLVEDAFTGKRLFEQTQIPDQAAFEDAFLHELRTRFTVEPDHRALLAEALRAGKHPERLADLLLACVRAGAPTVPITPRLDEAALTALAGRWAEATAAVDPGRLAERASSNGSTRGAVGRKLAELGAALAQLEADVAAGVPAWIPLVAARRRLDDELAYLGKSALRGWAEAREEAVQAYGAVVRQLIDEVPPLEAALAQRFLPAIVDRVAGDKQARGLFDFQDMLRVVHEVLRGPRGDELAERIRRRHPWALIDEFQDTDDVQWDIFRRIWGPAAPAAPAAADGADTPAPARGLTIVGDPKQSIYGFRGADVQAYLRARAELIAAGATQVVLGVNRRSTAPLVAAVNRLLTTRSATVLATLAARDQLAPDDPRRALHDELEAARDPFFAGGIRYDQPVTASGQVAGEPELPAVVVLAVDGGKQAIEAQRAAVLAAIGDELERLLAAPPRLVRHGQARPVSARDCLVLTRSNKESAEVAEALRRRAIPCALAQAERLYDTDEAAQLADLLDAIAAPRDRSRRLRAWVTDFFGCAWDELAGLADVPDHHPLAEPLFAWNALAQRRDYERLFAAILDDTRFVPRALAMAGGARAIVNVEHLCELLLAEVAASRVELDQLVRRLRGWTRDGERDRPDDGDLQRVESDGDAVQIMTIHRAKGLEAAVVFLYGGTGRPPPSRPDVGLITGDDGRVTAVGRGPGLTRAWASEGHEYQRLAYVALTRAQLRLYLPHYAPGASGGGDERKAYTPIQDALDRLAPGGVVPADAPEFEWRRISAPAPAAAPGPDALADLALAWPAPGAAAPTPSGWQAGRVVVSYSRLAHGAGAIAARADLGVTADQFDRQGETDPREHALALPADQLAPGAASGRFVHELFELVPLASVRDAAGASDDADAEAAAEARWAARPEVAEVVTQCARRHHLAGPGLAHGRRMVFATLRRPIHPTALELDGGGARPAPTATALPPLATADAVARELAFLFPLPAGRAGDGVTGPGLAVDADRGVVTGVLDALVRWGEQLWVVDYKTDVLPRQGADAGAVAAALVRERYAVQARLYALAGARLAAGAGAGAGELAGVLYLFVRDGVAVAIPTPPARLATWSRWLAGLTGEVAA